MIKKISIPIFFIFSFIISFGQNAGVQLKDLRTTVENSIRSGKYGDAVVFLSKYRTEIQNDTAYAELFEWLGELYLFQNDWDHIISLYKGHHFEKDEDSTLLTMARYFHSLPKEKINFEVSTAIKFEPSFSGTPVVEVIINGKIFHFWVDTGAGMSVVTSSVAKKINLKQSNASDASATAATGKKIDVGYGLIDSLKIGSMKVNSLPCLVLNDKQLEFKIFGIRIVKIDGIIGWNLLQELSVTIDHSQNILTLAPSTGNMLRKDQFFWMSVPLVACKDPKGNSLLFTFDTGADVSAVYPSYSKKEDTSKATHKTITIGSAGGKKKLKTLIFPAITLYGGGQTLEMHKCSTDPALGDGTLAPDGVLGNKDLKKYIMHFDLKAGVFELQLIDWRHKD